jgi:hypothetical protein
LPISEQVNTLNYPPWEKEELQNNPIFLSTIETSSPESRSLDFQEFLNTLPKNDIIIYSNGSKLLDGNTGAGFVIFQLGRQIGSGASPLGRVCEVEDAEVHAALQGIKSLFKRSMGVYG